MVLSLPEPTERAYSQMRSYALRSASVDSCGSDTTAGPMLPPLIPPLTVRWPPPLSVRPARLPPPALLGSEARWPLSPSCGTL